MDHEIVNGAGDIIGMEEDLINPSDLPEISPDEEETWTAEQEYERIKKERK